MSPREKIQAAYELAFYPPRIHQHWNTICRGEVVNKSELVELIDLAISLHLALPESGFASPRALHRLAFYQAQSRAYGMPRSLYNLRKAIEAKGEPPSGQVPGSLVRDIGLPEFSRPRKADG